MSNSRYGKIALLPFLFSLPAGVALAQSDSLSDAVASGTATLSLRYRYEFVDQDSFEERAKASTLRLRLNYETGAWNAWTGFIELDHVMEVLADEFNSGSGTSSLDRNRYPVVADPDGSDLNQLYVQYRPDDDWQLRLGRQRILLDDQRFVGGVGWRQNEQTFDGVSLNTGVVPRTTLFYSYVSNVNRIFGDTVPAGNSNHDTHLLNARISIAKDWNVVGYSYLIEDEDIASFSTATFGARLGGGVGPSGNRLSLLAEYATQSERANAPADFDTDYYRIDAGWSRGGFSAGAGIEVLGSDNGQAFRTPLATLHAFNGWADQFLTTPAAGLADRYLRLNYRHAGWSAELVYHDFSADAGNADYGSEMDASSTWSLGQNYSLLLKLAAFSADSPPYADTTKLWLMLTATY